MKKETIADGVELYLGDCREIIPMLRDRSVDFSFTDPPYGHNNNDGDLIHKWESALGRPQTDGSQARPIANDGHAEASALVRFFLRNVIGF